MKAIHNPSPLESIEVTGRSPCSEVKGKRNTSKPVNRSKGTHDFHGWEMVSDQKSSTE